MLNSFINIKFNQLALFSAMLSTLIIPISCGESIEKQEVHLPEISQDEIGEAIYNEVSADYEFIPPSTLQVASIFKKAGLNYDLKLTNPTTRINDYSTTLSQSLAFGVYSSDLAYSVIHEKYDEASSLLKTLRTLGSKIGLETIFNSSGLIEQFEANVTNQDSIIDILILLQENTDDYIEENGKQDLSVIYYTGAWIEGIYMGANTVMNDQEKRVGVLISEQMTLGEILVKGLKNIEDQNDDITDLIYDIQDLVDTYYKLESVSTLGEEAAYIDIVLTKEEIILMSGKIIELRESIVQ
ncbi:hypothetical protein OAN33_02745 [Flavobacteriales bacterium]|nr:hypothetical protein [Flavobacteriales bacterium]